MNFIDSHAHLTSSSLADNLEEVLQRAQEIGVSKIVNICTNKKSLSNGLELSKKHKWIFNAAAVHPHDVFQDGESYFPSVQTAAENNQIVAIGETGLDYHYLHSPKELQQQYLSKHLALATACKLPVIIHCREAFDDFFKLIENEYHGTGVLHCFTGNADDARKTIEKGWFISFSGIVTFKKSIELQDIVRFVPLERILIETDAPFLAPQNKRGKPNEPSFLVETAQKIADIKGINLEELAHITTDNATKLFNLFDVNPSLSHIQ